jgi:hypothetical protein
MNRSGSTDFAINALEIYRELSANVTNVYKKADFGINQ